MKHRYFSNPAIDRRAMRRGDAKDHDDRVWEAERKRLAAEAAAAAAASPAKQLTRCAASRDGECGHPQCPQLRDNEPAASGRHCPLDNNNED